MPNNSPRRISFPEINLIAENLRNNNQTSPFVGKNIGMSFGTSHTISEIIKTGIPYIIEEPRFGLIRNGRARISLNMIDYEIEANTILYMGKGCITQIKDFSEDLDICAMMVSNERISSTIEKAQSSFLGSGSASILVQVGKEEIELLGHLFETIWEFIHQEDIPEIALNGLIQTLVHYYLHLNKRKGNSTSSTKSHERIMFERFIELLNINCKKEHQIGFYADKMCVTPRYLGVVVKNSSGVTAKEWIDRALTTSAKIMLRHENKQTAEISEELNFKNPSFFCKFFKRMTGITPQDYRKE